jgi:Protein of unknown function (DUF3276)
VEDSSGKDRNEVYSKRVKAGKRTYFFDVKATRANDYYLTITESKRRMHDEGVSFEKHKIFLYKEDFDKFETALLGTLKHIKDELLNGYVPPKAREDEDGEIRSDNPIENQEKDAEKSDW